MEKSINQLTKEVYDNAKSKGFYDDGKANNMGERLCLIHSEVSEALEADRKGKYTTSNMDAVNGWVDNEDFKHSFLNNVKDNFEDELADIVIRCLDTAAHKGIDLEAHIKAKMRYNSMRPKLHGKKY